MDSNMIKPFARHGAYTIFDNVLLDYVMAALSPTAWKVLCVIVRQTVGWHKQKDFISQEQIAMKSGLSRRTVSRAVPELADGENPLIIVEKVEGIPNNYTLNKSFEVSTTRELCQPGTGNSDRLAQVPVPDWHTQNKGNKVSPSVDSALALHVNSSKDDASGQAPLLLSESESPKVSSSSNPNEDRLLFEWLVSNGIPMPRGDDQERAIRSPGVLMYVDVTNRWPGWQTAEFLERELGPEPKRAQLERAFELWCASGYRPQNTRGIMDWYGCLLDDPNWKPGPAKSGSYKAARASSDPRDKIHDDDYYSGDGGVM